MSMKMKTKLMLGICTLVTLSLASCADRVSPGVCSAIDPVGFWYGLWHGMILPVAFLFSLFDPHTAIYAAYNNGGWYDFGFVLGATKIQFTIMNQVRSKK